MWLEKISCKKGSKEQIHRIHIITAEILGKKPIEEL